MIAFWNGISEQWEDALWVFPVINFFLLLSVQWAISYRLDAMQRQRVETDNLLVESINQVVRLLKGSAIREDEIATDLIKDRQGVKKVARDLRDRTQRADDTDDDPGSAADAASRSK